MAPIRSPLIARRRLPIAALAALVAAPAHAQQPARPVIGLLGSATPQEWVDRLAAFRQGLREAGRTEGMNATIEYRWANGRYDRLPELAAELVARRVDVIVVLGNTASVLAAKAASATIPIVFRTAGDPVALGIVASLSRPGGNLTGITTLGVEVGPKQLEILHELAPFARIVAILVNPTNSALADMQKRTLSTAARVLGLHLELVTASEERDFEAVFAELRRMRAGALLIAADAFFNSKSDQLAALASRHSLPTISPYREFAIAGGLMSYGGSITNASRQAGIYTGRILAGEKPSDLPVQQVSRIELVLNLKAAKAIGIAVPEAFISVADEVIE